MVALEDFLKYRSLSNLKISLNESKAAFTIMQPCLNSNKYTKELWICDLDKDEKKGNFYKLLGDGEYLADFFWINDTSIFYPFAYKNGSTICRTINVITGKIIKEVYIPDEVNGIWYLNENRFFYTKEIEIFEEDYPKELQFLNEYDSDFLTIDEIPIYENGRGFISRKRTALYLWKVGEDPIKLTGEATSVDRALLKEDGLYFQARTYWGKNTEPGIYFIDRNGKQYTNIIPEGSFRIFEFDVITNENSDKKLILFSGHDKKQQIMSSDAAFFVADKRAIIKMDISEASIGDSVGTDCVYGEYNKFTYFEKELYFITTRNYGSQILSADKNNKIRKVTPEGGTVNGFQILRDGSVLYIGMRGLSAQELYYSKENKLHKLSCFNDESLDQNDLSVPETFTFKNHGYSIHYVVLKPFDFNPEKKYPAILYIHGGAKTLYSTVFFHEMQFLSSCGYFVIYGNPHGSDGQGSEFAELLGHYGEKDYDDLMKAMDEALVRYPNIDKNRLGVAGGSYGGIMTNWLVTHTNRFKAAVAQRSICNMVSTFGTADNGYNFVKEQMDGDLWDGFEKLWRQSPLKYADQCRTPLLLIHSEEDFRCHYTEAFQMFTALKYFGTESKIILIKGENHNLSRNGRPVQRIKRLYEIKKWFDEHLLETVQEEETCD